MDEARNVKFGRRTDLVNSHLMNDKTPAKEALASGSRGEFLKFKPFSVNLEQVKLETSKLIYG